MKIRSRIISALISVAIIAGIAIAANGPYPSVGLYWLQNSDPTTAGGVTAPLNQLLIRTDSPSIYYKSGATNTAWTRLGTGTASGGTVTSITCGAGILCVPNPIIATGTATLNITPTVCSAGFAETSTASDGTSSCSPFVPAASISGTTNTISKFTSSTTLGNSSVTDDGTTTAVGDILASSNATLAGVNSLTASVAPSALSGSTDNYAPAGLSTSSVLRQDVSSAATLTGIAPTTTTIAVNGRLLVIQNLATNTANTLTLANESGSSTAANRFTLPTGVSWVIPAGGSITLRYSGTTLRWVPVESPPVGPTGTVTSITCGTGLLCSPNPIIATGTESLNITTTTCSAGFAEISTASDGTSSCAAFTPAASVSGTTNTIAKFTSSSAIGNSAVTDDGTTTSVGDILASSNATLAGVNALTTSVAPTALSGSTNDYAPAGLSTSSVLRQDVSSAATLTGIVPTTTTIAVNGRLLVVQNLSTTTANTLTLANESASSAAANRFTLPNGVSWVIPAGGAVTLRYSNTTSRWVPTQSPGTDQTHEAFIYTATGAEAQSFDITLPVARSSTNYIAIIQLANQPGGLYTVEVPASGYTTTTIHVNTGATVTTGDKFAVLLVDLT